MMEGKVFTLLIKRLVDARSILFYRVPLPGDITPFLHAHVYVKTYLGIFCGQGKIDHCLFCSNLHCILWDLICFFFILILQLRQR